MKNGGKDKKRKKENKRGKGEQKSGIGVEKREFQQISRGENIFLGGQNISLVKSLNNNFKSWDMQHSV